MCRLPGSTRWSGHALYLYTLHARREERDGQPKQQRAAHIRVSSLPGLFYRGRHTVCSLCLYTCVCVSLCAAAVVVVVLSPSLFLSLPFADSVYAYPRGSASVYNAVRGAVWCDADVGIRRRRCETGARE